MPRSVLPRLAGLAVGASLIIGLAAPCASAADLFLDEFKNDSAIHSDNVPHFWNAVGNQGDIFVRNQHLVFHLPGGGKTPQTSTLRSHGARPTFNFFERAHTFTVTGLSVKNPQAGDNVGKNPQNSVVQFFLSPPDETPSTSATSSANLVGLRIRANGGVELGFKQNSAGENVFSGPRLHLERRLGPPPAITGFSLTLDATSYSLVLVFSDLTKSEPFTGRHLLDAASWGRGAQRGQSSIGFVVQSFISGGVANDTEVRLDSFRVSQDR